MRTPASLRSRRVLTAGVLALALSGGLAACGGEDDSDELPAGLPAQTTATETATETETTPTETKPTEEPAGEAVAVAADPEGQLAFTEKTLEVKAGKVTFEFTNESPVPHDFAIEEDGKEVAKTKVISESKETIEAELEAGDPYQFYCSVPGHRQAGMEGELTVK